MYGPRLQSAYLHPISIEREIDMTECKVRRTRGPGPRGKFEVSKEVAFGVINATKTSQREKTERLKAQRLAQLSCHIGSKS
jgi:hypothetical protein